MHMKGRGLAVAGAAFGLALSLATAFADDPTGTWLRENGNSKIRMAKCGEALCGTVSWLKDAGGPSKIGQRVFFDMMPAGAAKWRGKAFNPEDGKTYSGEMSLSGETLTTAGCALGGLVCRTVKWSRSN